jgi:hypothetical protein
MLDFVLNTYSGYKPLEVSVVSVTAEVFSSGINVFSISTYGSLGDSMDISTFGYLYDVGDYTYKWYIDDTFVGANWTGTTFTEPGIYEIRLEQLDSNNSVVADRKRLVKVLDKSLINIEISRDTAQVLSYGNDYNSGFGWREYNGIPLAPTKGSVLNIKDGHIERLVVLDSDTGLPYFINPHMPNEIPYLDYYDMWLGSGVDIPTKLRLQDITGTSQHHLLKLSDVFLCFEPIDRDMKGKDGYSDDGFDESMTVSPCVTIDRDSGGADKVSDYPFKNEIYFNKDIISKFIQVGFETNKSKYKFVRAEVYALPYDKALIPHSNHPKQWEYQSVIGTPVVWFGRYMMDWDLTLTTQLPDGFEYLQFTTPIGDNTGSFRFNTGYLLDGVSYVVWSTNSSLGGNEYYKKHGVNGTTWYLYYMESTNINVSSSDVLYDYRKFNTHIGNSVVDYYYDDIVNNKGRNVLNG